MAACTECAPWLLSSFHAHTPLPRACSRPTFAQTGVVKAQAPGQLQAEGGPGGLGRRHGPNASVLTAADQGLIARHRHVAAVVEEAPAPAAFVAVGVPATLSEPVGRWRGASAVWRSVYACMGRKSRARKGSCCSLAWEAQSGWKAGCMPDMRAVRMWCGACMVDARPLCRDAGKARWLALCGQRPVCSPEVAHRRGSSLLGSSREKREGQHGLVLLVDPVAALLCVWLCAFLSQPHPWPAKRARPAHHIPSFTHMFNRPRLLQTHTHTHQQVQPVAAHTCALGTPQPHTRGVAPSTPALLGA